MLQYVNIKDSKVQFVNKDKDPAKRSDQLESDLGNLLIESAMDKMIISSLEDTVGNLLFEVAALKGGAA